MPVDSIVDKTGGLSFPLDPGDFENTLVPLDPARNRLLSLFQAAINYELSAVWTKVTSHLKPNHALSGTQPVQDTLELRPSAAVMQQRKAAFPLLCLHRTGRAIWEEHTLEIEKRTQDWALLYIMPPLDVLDQRRFGDIVQAIPAIIRRVIRNHGHKAFENGALQFFGDTSGIGAIKLVASTDFGNAPFAEGPDAPIYFTVVCELQTIEYSQDQADEFGELEGIDYAIGVGDEHEVTPRLIEAADDVPVVNE